MRFLRLLCLCVLTAAALPAQAPTGPQRADLLARLGLPASFAGEIQTSTVDLPVLGVSVLRAKATDASGQTVSGSWIGDQEVDFSSLRKQEIAARQATPAAKIRPDLRAKMEAGMPAIRVSVWLDFPAAEWDAHINGALDRLGAEASHDEREALETVLADWVQARVAENNQPVVEWVQSKGYLLRYVSTTAPALFLTLSPAQIEELAAHPQVDTLYLESLNDADTNESANQSHRTNRVHENGVRGRNVRFALLENNGVDPNHPYLNVTEWFDPANPNPDNHIQGTSGCVASQYEPRLGAAPDVLLFSANAASYSDTDVTAAGDWIGTRNISITNNSWGPQGSNPGTALDYSDRYFDYQSRFFTDSYFFSAGNAGLGNDVGNRGWNTIAVGSHSDQDDADWGNDVMSTFSATGDPATGCEKPNLVAVGDTIDTLGLSTQPTPWLYDNYSGTSFSSPHAAANLANALVVDSTMSAPEAAMALMMATCWHNIEGDARLSEQDGAGGIHGLALYRAARDSKAISTTLNSGSFSTNGYHTRNIFLQGGDPVRVAIAWASNVDASYTTNVLDADLDLAVYEGQDVTSGTSFGFSSSFNNNFEIVTFTPPNTGWYTVRINDFRFDGVSERVGIAWSQKTTDGSSFRLRQRSTSNATTNINATIGNFRWFDFDAVGSANTPYLFTPGAEGFGGFSFGSQTWSPLSFDLWTLLYFDHITSGAWYWFDAFGTLSSSGRSSTNRFLIPPLPPLEGWEIKHVGYTLDPAFPNSVKEISDVATTKFMPEGTSQPTSDDGSEEIQLPFAFPFYGQTYNSVFVNMNGNLTFGTGDSDFTESESELLADQPRIALFWDDLGPHQSGTVVAREVRFGEREVSIDFVKVPERTSSGSGTGENTGRITLRENGRILLEWKNCDLSDCIVGLSPGGGASGTAVDLTSSGQRTLSGAIYQQFTTGDAFDLSSSSIWWSKIRFIPSGSSSYRVECELK